LLGVAPVGVVHVMAQLDRLRLADRSLQQPLEPGSLADQQHSCLGLPRSGGSALLRCGELQVDKAAQVQPGAAGAMHQPQPHLGHRCGAPAGCAAPDGGGDIGAEEVMEGPVRALPSLHRFELVIATSFNSLVGLSDQVLCRCQLTAIGSALEVTLDDLAHVVAG
jgi:hypothetical protein